MKYWKEAATIILAAKSGHQGPLSQAASTMSKLHQEGHAPSQSSFDYKVLMLQRAHKSTFFGGAQVFPGGAIDKADLSPKWLELFAEAGIKTLDDFGSINMHQNRPPMVKTQMDSPIPSDIAFRICAIREMFEESGVLLVKHLRHCHPPDADTPPVQLNLQSLGVSSEAVKTEWRQRIYKDANQFLQMCRELNSLPDIWSLSEWSNWLTPSNSRKRRFDTMFYLCCTDSQPSAFQDEKETIHSEWVTPSQSLFQYSQSEVFLPPPQVYEFQRLCRFPKLGDLFSFSQKRALLGCERLLPVMMNCSDGVVSVLPGDCLYPAQPVLETITDDCVPLLEGRIEEYRDMSKPVHRQTFALEGSPICQTHCNLTLPYNHCSPLSYAECVDVPSSKL